MGVEMKITLEETKLVKWAAITLHWMDDDGGFRTLVSVSPDSKVATIDDSLRERCRDDESAIWVACQMLALQQFDTGQIDKWILLGGNEYSKVIRAGDPAIITPGDIDEDQRDSEDR